MMWTFTVNQLKEKHKKEWIGRQRCTYFVRRLGKGIRYNSDAQTMESCRKSYLRNTV